MCTKVLKIGVSVIVLVVCIMNVRCKKTTVSVNTIQIQNIDSLNTVAFAAVRTSDWDKAQTIALKASDLAKKYHYSEGIAKSLRVQAYYWNHQQQLDSAFSKLSTAAQLEISTKNHKGLLAVYNTKALLYKRNELFDEALDVYQKALNIRDSSITKSQQSKTHINIANVYTKTGNYERAVHHYHQALWLLADDSTNSQTVKVYANLGNVYSLSADYKQAETYYTKALQYYQTSGNPLEEAKLYNNLGALFYEKGDDALSLTYFKKSIKLKEELQNVNLLIEGYLNIAELYATRNTELAFSYLDKAFALVKATNTVSYEAKIHLSKAAIYQSQEKYPLAKKALEKAIKISDGQEKLTFERYLNKMQSEIAFQEQNFKKAYQYRVQYEKLNDSIFNEQKLWDIAAIQRASQAKVKNAEISLLEKDRMLAEEIALREQQENKTLSIFLIILGVIVGLVSIIAFYFYKLKKASSQLAKQQELLLKERIQNLVNNQEIEIINASLEAREKEKVAISKELHNNIGSLLTSVNFHIQAFDETILATHKATKQLYEKTLQIVQTITHEIRSLSHRFDQNPVPEFDLKMAISNFSEKVTNEKLSVQTSIHGLEQFQNSRISIFIFRILQELVNNAMKHAAAQNLIIYITKNSDSINVMVEDDGKGFQTHHIAKGIGLKNLKKEIQYMNGTCDIDSSPTRGTTVNIDIPV